MKNKTETKEVLSILKTIMPSVSNEFYCLPIDSLKKYSTIQEAWNNCNDSFELLMFKMLCSGPQNRKHKKMLSGKIKLIFKEIKKVMQNDVNNIPEWFKEAHPSAFEDPLGKIELMEGDFLHTLDQEYYEDYYENFAGYIENVIPEIDANIVKKHLQAPTIEDVKKLLPNSVTNNI